MSKWIDLPKYTSYPRLLPVAVGGGWVVAQMSPMQIHTHHVFLPKAFYFAQKMNAGESFPPVKIFWDKVHGRWMASDGAHRVCAAKMLNRPAMVRYRPAKCKSCSLTNP